MYLCIFDWMLGGVGLLPFHLNALEARADRL